VSRGDIIKRLHRLADHFQPRVQALKTEIQASPAIQADETTWREDGLNGSIWSVSTPPVRSSKSNHSRAGDVVTPVIGEHIQGVLGNYFSAGDTISQGSHQRCRVHSVRDIHTRKETVTDEEEVRR
jgi:hypothetical protein